jgi:hypothetical protein
MSEWDDIGTCLSNRRGLAARLFDQSDICKMQQVTERNSRKREEKKASERKIIQEKEKKSMQFLAAVLSIDPKGL